MRRVSFTTIILLSLVATAALAGPTYEVLLGEGGAGCGYSGQSSDLPLILQLPEYTSLGSLILLDGYVESFANRGAIGGLIEIDLRTEDNPVQAEYFRSGCFITRIEIDDLVISGPGPTVMTQLRSRVDANLFETVNAHGAAEMTAQASMSLHSVPGNTVTQTWTDSMNEVIATPLVEVPVGQPIRASLELSIQGLAYAARVNVDGEIENGRSHVLVNAMNTMSFPTDGPVLELPPGYTANSTQGLIMNNQYAGAPVASESTSWGALKSRF